MDIGDLILRGSILWSPLAFAVLITLATVLIWLAIGPARPRPEVEQRLDGYLDRVDVIEAEDMGRSFGRRVFLPVVRRTLGALPASDAPAGFDNAVMVAISDAGRVEMLNDLRPGLPDLETLIVCDPGGGADDDIPF